MRQDEVSSTPAPAWATWSRQFGQYEVEDHQLRDKCWVCDAGDGGEQAKEVRRGNELQVLVSVLTI